MKKYLLLSLAVLLTCAQVFAQERSISGVVTDGETGEPVPGANIVVKGTTTGTVTDIDGNYTLFLPEGAETIQVSFVGYTTSEETIGDRSKIDVALLTDATTLEDVVVVGYGIQEKKEITSAVQSVKAEDFNQGNIANPAQLLQGKVPGLNISGAGGSNPHAGFNIRLRGVSSVGENTQPLVVVDGVIGVDLQSVDPNDIESMDVLKDGSAAAIYGTRASAGVIMITTKTGSTERTQVDFNTYGAFEFISRQNKVLKSEEFTFLGGKDNGYSTDWQDEISRVGYSQSHNIALSGGSKTTNYRASITYRNNNGVLKTSGFDQLSARLNIDQKIFKDKVKLSLQAANTMRDANYAFDDAWKFATINNPTNPVRSDDAAFVKYGGYYEDEGVFGVSNPVALLEQNQNVGEDRNFLLTTGAEWNIIDNLTFRATYSLTDKNETRSKYISNQSKYDVLPGEGTGVNNRGFAERGYKNFNRQLFESTLNYSFDIDRLTTTLLAGYSYQYNVDNGFSVGGMGIASPYLLYNDLGSLLSWVKDPNAGKQGKVSSYKNDNTLVGLFGRVNLNYDDTYFLSASYRHEGSSKFGTANKWGGFPAVSAGLDLARLMNTNVVDNLKFRAGYGVTGNLPKDSYLSVERYSFQSWESPNVGGYEPLFIGQQNENPNLRWEQKSEINVGIDYAILQNKFTGSLDFYTRNTIDFILEQQVPVPPNKFEKTWINAGELQNSGVEFAINWAAVDGNDFSYTPGFNMSYLESKIVSLAGNSNAQYLANAGTPGLPNTPLVRAKEGQPIGELWGLEYSGIGEDGKWQFVDQNGDGKIDESNGPETDKVVIGNGLPKVTLGFSNMFRYKNFDANIFFRGAFGHNLVNTYRLFYQAPVAMNDPGNVLRSTTKLQDLKSTEPRVVSSYFVEDASYLLLDNLTIGYTLNTSDSEVFKKVRFYLTGQNLFYITGYSGISPEVRYDDNGNPLAPGIERTSTWVTTRTVSFGANLSF